MWVCDGGQGSNQALQELGLEPRMWQEPGRGLSLFSVSRFSRLALAPVLFSAPHTGFSYLLAQRAQNGFLTTLNNCLNTISF